MPAALVGVGIVVAAWSAASARAAVGELRRWGGYDASGTTPGAFHDPQGLGVDRTTNDVFVLDRVSLGTPYVIFRIQEFTPSGGSPTASATFKVPFSDTTSFTDYPLSEGVAVDPSLNRLYVLVDTFGSRSQVPRPVATKVLAFSYAGGRIAPASQLPGGVLAGPGELLGSTPASDLYLPQGIAVDPATHDVIIDASRPDTTSGGPPTGPVVLQRIYGQTRAGHAAGSLGARWTDPGLLQPVSGNAPGGSLSVGSDGTAYVYQAQGLAGNNNLGGAVVRIGPDFGSASIFISSSTSQIGFSAGINPLLGSLSIADISGTQTGYGTYFDAAPDGTFVGVYNGPTGVFNSGNPPDVGYRRLDSAGGDLGIVGGGADGATCNIDTQASGVAAGKGGVFYVLMGADADGGGDSSSPREVVEFGPGGRGCPVLAPFAAFNPVDQAGHQTLELLRGTPVTLDARVSTLEGAHATEVNWDTDGDSSTTDGPHHDGFNTIVTGSGGQPAPLTLTTRFTELNPSPGNDLTSVPLRLQIRTSDGQTTQIQPGTVLVRDQPAVASFRSPGPIPAGHSVTFDASASFDPDGGPGATITHRILSYQWNFGDGSSPTTTASPQQSHIFPVGGVYTVTLSVSDRDTGIPFFTSHQVAVTQSAGGGPAGSTRQGTALAGPDLPSDEVLLGETSGSLASPATQGVAGTSASSKGAHALLPAGSFTVSTRGVLRLPIGCIAGPECIGALGIGLPTTGADQLPTWLAQDYIQVPGGKTRTTSLQLNRQGRKLLRRHHALTLLVALTQTAPSSADLQSTVTALRSHTTRYRRR